MAKYLKMSTHLPLQTNYSTYYIPEYWTMNDILNCSTQGIWFLADHCYRFCISNKLPGDADATSLLSSKVHHSATTGENVQGIRHFVGL